MSRIENRIKKIFQPLTQALSEIWNSSGTLIKSAPFSREPVNTKRFMTSPILALLPLLAAAVYYYGPRVLLLTGVSYAVGGALEVIWAIARDEEISEGFLVTGLVFPLTLPPMLPLWLAGLGIGLSVGIGKILFGGTGRNPFNPALVGRCLIFLGFPGILANSYRIPGYDWSASMSLTNLFWTDAITCATPLATAAKSGVLSFASLPGLLTPRAGCCGEIIPGLIILGGLFLLLSGTSKPRIWTGILTGSALTTILLMPAGFFPHNLSPFSLATLLFLYLCLGGLPLGAVYMAVDPVTSPITNPGQLVSGLIIGCMAILIRFKGAFPEGVMFAILMANLCKPALDSLFLVSHFSRNRSIPRFHGTPSLEKVSTRYSAGSELP